MGARPVRSVQVLLRVVDRQYDDLGARTFPTQRADRFHAVAFGKRDIGNHNVGLKLLRQRDSLSQGARFGDHLKIAFGIQECAKAVAQDGMIVDQNEVKLSAMQGTAGPRVTVRNGKHGRNADDVMSHGLVVHSVEPYIIYKLRESSK